MIDGMLYKLPPMAIFTRSIVTREWDRVVSEWLSEWQVCRMGLVRAHVVCVVVAMCMLLYVVNGDHVIKG